MDKVLIGKLVTSRETGMTRKYMVKANVKNKSYNYIRVDGEMYDLNTMLPMYNSLNDAVVNFDILLPYNFRKDDTISYLDAIEKLKDGQPHYVTPEHDQELCTYSDLTSMFPYDWWHGVLSDSKLRNLYHSCTFNNGSILYRDFNHKAVFVRNIDGYDAIVPFFMHNLKDNDISLVSEASNKAFKDYRESGYKTGRVDEIAEVKKYAKILRGQ